MTERLQLLSRIENCWCLKDITSVIDDFREESFSNIELEYILDKIENRLSYISLFSCLN